MFLQCKVLSAEQLRDFHSILIYKLILDWIPMTKSFECLPAFKCCDPSMAYARECNMECICIHFSNEQFHVIMTCQMMQL